MLCYRWNKTNEMSEQTRTTIRTSLYVIANNKYGVRTKVRICYYYRQNKIFSIAKQDITIARTTYYYSRNKFVCHLEQNKKNSVRTNENNC
jgi:hypothetical protein